VRYLKKEIVCGYATREQVVEHPDRIVFTEYEINQAGKASSYA
jgi:hypothetical protein